MPVNINNESVSNEEIKKLLGSDKLIIGADKTMKAMRAGKLKKIFLASNANPKIVKDIEYYKDLAKIEIEVLSLTNEEIGAVCRKPYMISIMGVLK